LCANVHITTKTKNMGQKIRKSNHLSMLLRQMLLKCIFSGIEIVSIKKIYINFDNNLEKKCRTSANELPNCYQVAKSSKK